MRGKCEEKAQRKECRKNLYDHAINLARRHKCTGDELANIHRQYADYMYQKGDYDHAVQEYKETIGYLPPSYVICKVGEISWSY